MATNLSSRLTFRMGREEDGERLREIVGQSFSEEEGINGAALERYLEEAYYQPERLLVAELDGKVVGQLGLRPGQTFMKGKGFPGSTVGTVCTETELRGKGIGAALMNYAIDTMIERGEVLSRLHAHSERHAFYERLGYLPTPTCRPCSRIEIDEQVSAGLAEWSSRAEGLELQSGHPEDAEELNRLYEARVGKATGGVTRSLRFWTDRLTRRPKLWLDGTPVFDVIRRADGKPCAYAAVMVEWKPPVIIELVAEEDPPELPRMLVGSILNRLSAAGIREVELDVDSRSSYWPALKVFRPVECSEEGVVFLQLHNPREFLESALPELDLAATESDLTVRLELPDRNHPYGVGKGSKKVTVSLTPSQLLSLYFNGRELDSMLKTRQVRLEPNTPTMRKLLGRVLPETHACRCRMDAY